MASPIFYACSYTGMVYLCNRQKSGFFKYILDERGYATYNFKVPSAGVVEMVDTHV